MEQTAWTPYVADVQRAYKANGDTISPDDPTIQALTAQVLRAMQTGECPVDYGTYRRARRKLHLDRREAMRRVAAITALSEVDRLIDAPQITHYAADASHGVMGPVRDASRAVEAMERVSNVYASVDPLCPLPNCGGMGVLLCDADGRICVECGHRWR